MMAASEEFYRPPWLPCSRALNNAAAKNCDLEVYGFKESMRSSSHAPYGVKKPKEVRGGKKEYVRALNAVSLIIILSSKSIDRAH